MDSSFDQSSDLLSFTLQAIYMRENNFELTIFNISKEF